MNGPSADVSPDYEAFEPRFHHFMLANAGLEALASGFRWTEGPVWMGDWGALLFQDLPNNRTLRWIDGAGVSVYRAPSDYANGQTRDRDGRLVACSHRRRCLVRTERDGAVTRLVDRHNGKRLNAPNDIVTHPDGALWFTDPLYGISNDYEGGRQESEQPPALYRFDPADGSIRVMADDFAGPNGLAFSPDFRRLYVAETGDQSRDNPEQLVRVFDMTGEGAATRLSGGGPFHRIAPGYADGFAVDEEGFVWASAADGVHCIDAGGTLMGRIVVPARVANVAFGGVSRDRLFICAGSTVYAIFVNRRGARLP